LGFVPNSWRPTSRGEKTFGETKGERYAGNIGSLLGIAGTGGLAYVGRSAIAKGGKAMLGKIPKASAKAGEYAGRAGVRANNIRMSVREKMGNLSSLRRGDTYFSGIRERVVDPFMRPFREQNLLDQALRTGSSAIRSVV